MYRNNDREISTRLSIFQCYIIRRNTYLYKEKRILGVSVITQQQKQQQQQRKRINKSCRCRQSRKLFRMHVSVCAFCDKIL